MPQIQHLTARLLLNVSTLNRANFVLNLRGIYDSSRVIIRGYTTGSGASEATMSGAQVVIDSTGRAQDIVRRIKINAPIRPDIVYPPFTLQIGGDICKRLSGNAAGNGR